MLTDAEKTKIFSEEEKKNFSNHSRRYILEAIAKKMANTETNRKSSNGRRVFSTRKKIVDIDDHDFHLLNDLAKRTEGNLKRFIERLIRQAAAAERKRIIDEG